MQALMILAYKDIDQLRYLLNQVKGHFKLFINIEKKSSISISDVWEILGNDPDAVIIKKYNIVWGEYNHLRAVTDLLKIISEQEDIEYIHIISGQSLVVRPIEDFDSFITDNKIYMTCTQFWDIPKKIQNRINRYNLFIHTDPRKKHIQRLNNLIAAIQKALRIHRYGIGQYSRDEIYKGMLWVSMPMTAVRYVLDYIQNNARFMRDIKHCILPEEYFFQTILMNSEFRDSIISDNRHYTCWEFRNGSRPAYLDETDFDKIVDSGAFFARKIDSVISKGLVERFSQINGNTCG